MAGRGDGITALSGVWSRQRLRSMMPCSRNTLTWQRHLGGRLTWGWRLTLRRCWALELWSWPEGALAVQLQHCSKQPLLPGPLLVVTAALGPLLAAQEGIQGFRGPWSRRRRNWGLQARGLRQAVLQGDICCTHPASGM